MLAQTKNIYELGETVVVMGAICFMIWVIYRKR
jgi:hypothetical protein